MQRTEGWISKSLAAPSRPASAGGRALGICLLAAVTCAGIAAARLAPAIGSPSSTSSAAPHASAAPSASVAAAAKGDKAAEPARAPAKDKSPAASLPAGVILRINGKDIPRQRFISELDDVLGESYRETFISHVLIDEKAKILGVAAIPAEIDEHAQANMDQVLRERFGGDSKRMEDALKERGMSLAGWKKRLLVDTRYDLLVEKMILKDRPVSEDTLTRLFEERYGQGGVQIKIRHIQRNVPVAASQDYTLQQYEQDKPAVESQAKARADEALGKIRGGEAFETVMSTYSDDPRKISGGVLTTWKGRYGPELDAAASKLGKGDVSDVIKGGDGYRIVQCTDSAETEEVHALHILLATGPRGKGRSEADAEQKAKDILEQIKKGGDFEQLAKDNSDDPGSAVRGGDLGFFGRRAMVAPFEEAAFSMTPGQITEAPVKTNFGYHIIKVLEKRKTEEKTLRQILVGTQFVVVKDRRVRPALEAKAQSDLDAALAEIKKPGGSFAETAKTVSEDNSTKADGGLLKNYREGMFGGAFDEAVRSLKAEDAARVVKDAAGNLHLVMVEEIVKTDLGSVRQQLQSEEMKRPPSPQEKADYVTRLRESATIVS